MLSERHRKTSTRNAAHLTPKRGMLPAAEEDE
jgi:hypothetical protein